MKKLIVPAVAVFALLTACGEPDDVGATAVSKTSSTTSSEVAPTLPPASSAETSIVNEPKLEASTDESYMAERQQTFTELYLTLAPYLAKAVDGSFFAGGVHYYVATNATVFACPSPDDSEAIPYDFKSTEMVLACSGDRRHAVVRPYVNGSVDLSKPIEGLKDLPEPIASVMFNGVVIAPTVDGFFVDCSTCLLPLDPEPSDLKQCDDLAIGQLKDAALNNFGPSIAAQLGLG